MDRQTQIDFPAAERLAMIREARLPAVKLPEGCRVSASKQKAVLSALNELGQGRECAISRRELAAAAGCAERTARRTILALERLSLLCVALQANAAGQVIGHFRIVWSELALWHKPPAAPPIPQTPGPQEDRTPWPIVHGGRSSMVDDRSSMAPDRSSMVDDRSSMVDDRPHGTIEEGVSNSSITHSFHGNHGAPPAPDQPQPIGAALAAAIETVCDPARQRRQKAELVDYLTAAVADSHSDPSIFRRAADLVLDGKLPQAELEGVAEAVRRKRKAGQITRSPGAYFLARIRKLCRDRGLTWQEPYRQEQVQ